MLASPHLEALRGSTVVIKYGGAAMEEEPLKDGFALDVAALRAVGLNVVVVHGGGAEVTEMADRLGIATEFVEGQRRTDASMLDIATMVLAGRINKDLVRRINVRRAGAIGLCGLDNNMIVARKRRGHPDLGLVGEVTGVRAGFLRTLIGGGLTPVIAPIAAGDDGQAYNVNADVVAGAVAAALDASVLLYMSNVEGIAVDGITAAELDEHEAARLTSTGAISGGMIPKVRAAFDALAGGAGAVRIVDGRPPRALLRALADPTLGTTISKVRELMAAGG